jgi:hypothetical protein
MYQLFILSWKYFFKHHDFFLSQNFLLLQLNVFLNFWSLPNIKELYRKLSTLNFGWDPPMEHSSKLCIYLTQWFLSRKCKKFGMFTHNVMTIAHMAYWRGELKLVSVCPIKAFHCHFWISVEKKNQSYFQVYADTNFACSIGGSHPKFSVDSIYEMAAQKP